LQLWQIETSSATQGVSSHGCIASIRIDGPSNSARLKTPLSLEEAKRMVEEFEGHYNNHRLDRAIGYVTPSDIPAGRQQAIHEERDRKLEAARALRAKTSSTTSKIELC
jgi:transposase InsO family protein